MILAMIEPVFAQVRQGQGGQQGGGDAAGAIFSCVCYGLIFAIALVVHILFLMTMSKTLAACSQRNRTMEPGQVWLNLIPLFGIVWMFITVIRMSETLKNEYEARGMRSDDPEFGKMTGLLWLIFNFIPCVNIVAIVFFIMYWVKMAGYKNELLGSKGSAADYDDDFDRPRRPRDDDDDRPRRPRGGDEDRHDDDDDRPRRPRRDDD
jgi:hypothetical protein